MLSRRKLLRTAGAAALFVPAAPYIAKPQILRLSGGPVGFWPGMPGNPVGFDATPTLAPVGVWPGGTWPGKWPGSFTGGGPISTANYAAGLGGGLIPSGTPGNPTIISFVDFDGAGNTNAISDDGADHSGGGHAIHDVTFVGCRFQGSAYRAGYDVECFKNDSSNVAFIFCSFTPRRTAGPWYSKALSPAVINVAQPGSWPSGSVGTGNVDLGGGIAPIAGGGAGAYQTYQLSGCSFGISIGSDLGTYMIIDHCDFWGNQFGISPATGSTPTMVTDNWIHDPRFPACPVWDVTFPYVAETTFATGAYVQGSDNNKYLCLISNTGINPVGDVTGHWTFYDTNDHTNGISFAQGTLQPGWNWLIKHNTIAGLGNTRCIGWQSTSSNYQNIRHINNYLSGFNDTVDMGSLATGSINTGWLFTDNIFATDLPFVNCCIDHPASSPNGTQQTQFTNSGAFANANNLWRRNKLQIYPGDTWSGFNASNGLFVLPEGGSVFNSVDWSS